MLKHESQASFCNSQFFHNQPVKKMCRLKKGKSCVLIKRKETITLIHGHAAASLSDGRVGDFCRGAEKTPQ